VLAEDLEPELLGAAARHEEDAGDAVRDLARVAARRRAVAPLRERLADLAERLLGRARADAVVLGDEDLGALRRRPAGGCGRRGELERLDRKDLLVEEARRLGLGGALLRDGGELVHALARNVEVCRAGGAALVTASCR